MPTWPSKPHILRATGTRRDLMWASMQLNSSSNVAVLLQNPFCCGYHNEAGGTKTGVLSASHPLKTKSLFTLLAARVGCWENPPIVPFVSLAYWRYRGMHGFKDMLTLSGGHAPSHTSTHEPGCGMKAEVSCFDLAANVAKSGSTHGYLEHKGERKDGCGRGAVLEPCRRGRQEPACA